MTSHIKTQPLCFLVPLCGKKECHQDTKTQRFTKTLKHKILFQGMLFSLVFLILIACTKQQIPSGLMVEFIRDPEGCQDQGPLT
jgi:hypothetical protein